MNIIEYDEYILKGLALKKGNPWLQKLSMQILSLHENGIMEDLDKEWILLNNATCGNKDSSPSTLGLTNMAGKDIDIKKLHKNDANLWLIHSYRCFYACCRRNHSWRFSHIH